VDLNMLLQSDASMLSFIFQKYTAWMQKFLTFRAAAEGETGFTLCV